MKAMFDDSESVQNKKKNRHLKKSIPTFLFKTYKIVMVWNFIFILFLRTSKEYLMISRTLFLNYSHITQYPYITLNALYFIRIQTTRKLLHSMKMVQPLSLKTMQNQVMRYFQIPSNIRILVHSQGNQTCMDLRRFVMYIVKMSLATQILEEEWKLLHKIKRRHGCERKNKKQYAAQVSLKSDYNKIKEDISYINKELDFFFQQFGQFQNTLTTLVESSHHLCLELNMIKSKNSTCNDLLCQMFMKLAQSNSLPLNIGNNPFFKTNQTTQSNRSSENNENNNNSSKEETNQSNQLIETEEKVKIL